MEIRNNENLIFIWGGSEMTENEAITRMQYRIETATCNIGKGVDGKAYEDMEMGIKALEEIQQYRAIGTVEKLRSAMERQIERKPSKIDVQPYFRKHCANKYSCPLCHQKIGTHQQKFCSYCGQKFDWSE